MVPGRVVQLRFDAFFEKREGLFSVFIQENSRQPECLMWTKIQHDVFDVQLFPSLQNLTARLSFLKREKLYDR